MEYTESHLAETCDALRIIIEGIEHEGLQSEEQFEEWKAIHFAHRVPLYLSSLNVALRELERISIQLTNISSSIYEYREEPNNA